MSFYDLNNPIDFARATNSFGAGLVQTFSARGSQQWLLQEGQYISGVDPSRNVVFHVFLSAKDYGGAVSQISDSGGRRKAKFEFPFLDGQLTADMGKMAENFSIEILLHGNNYLSAFNELMQVLNEPVPGKLIHPVRGPIDCVMESYELIHNESSRKAVAIRLNMTEHSLEPFRLLAVLPVSVPSRLAKLTNAFKKIEDAINAVQGALFLSNSVKLQIVNGLNFYQNGFSAATGRMNATFNSGQNIPALQPTQGGGLQDNTGAIVSNSVTVATSPGDPFADVPLELLSAATLQAIAIEQIQKDIDNTRLQLSSIIEDLQGSDNGQGALYFHDNILQLRETAVDLQDTFEAGKQSSQAQVIDYVTPQIMSVREIAFANGIGPDDSAQIAILNPDLESINLIPKGSTVRVAIG